MTNWIELRKEAALQQVKEWGETRQHIEDVMLGSRTSTRDRLGEVIKVDDVSFVVEVITHGHGTFWTTVYRDHNDHVYYTSVDQALLRLVGVRHGTDTGATEYAARVLRVPTD